MISFNFLITIILNLICIVTLFSCTCSLLSCIEKFFKQQKKYIASPEEKEIIDIFVQSNLIMIPEFSLSMVEFNLKFTITYRLIDQEENIYMNNEGIYIKIIDNILYEVVEDEEGNPILKPSDYVLLS